MTVVRETIYETQNIAELRQYVAELEARLAQGAANAAPVEQALHAYERFQRTLFEHTPVGLTLQRIDGALLDVNPAFAQIIGYSHDAIVERLSTVSITPPEYAASDHCQVQQVRLAGVYGPYEKEYLRQDGSRVPVRMQGRLVEHQGQTLIWSTIEDISERVRADASRRQAIYQEELIRAQAAALEELSTPLMPIGERVVVMPLIGAIDQARAERIMATLLHGVQQHHALTVIIDVTGVAMIDTYVANVLVQAAQGARLLGARVMLTGIGPEVAQTVVHLGVDLRGITMYATLQRAVAVALRC